MKPLPQLPTVFKVTLVDDALAPRLFAGDSVEFTCDMTPEIGDGVLVLDERSGRHVEEFRGHRPGVVVLAVVTGLPIRLSQPRSTAGGRS